MHFNLLELFFLISGAIILLVSYDIARRERFNALHFVVFLSIGLGLIVFVFFPQFLQIFGKLFGLERGADALVYISIIFLIYFSILLLTKTEENRYATTLLMRQIALSASLHPLHTRDHE